MTRKKENRRRRHCKGSAIVRVEEEGLEFGGMEGRRLLREENGECFEGRVSFVWKV